MASPQAASVRSFSSGPAPQTAFAPPQRPAMPGFSSAAAAAAARVGNKDDSGASVSQHENRSRFGRGVPATVAGSAKSEPETQAAAEAATAETRAAGITQEQVLEIKTAIQSQQKFLGEIVNQGSRWELEGAELKIYFSAEQTRIRGNDGRA